MDERENIIQLWFDMCIQQKDLGIDDIFTEDVTYIESWGPKVITARYLEKIM